MKTVETKRRKENTPVKEILSKDCQPEGECAVENAPLVRDDVVHCEPVEENLSFDTTKLMAGYWRSRVENPENDKHDARSCDAMRETALSLLVEIEQAKLAQGSKEVYENEPEPRREDLVNLHQEDDEILKNITQFKSKTLTRMWSENISGDYWSRNKSKLVRFTPPRELSPPL